jgi:hypothetical protein
MAPEVPNQTVRGYAESSDLLRSGPHQPNRISTPRGYFCVAAIALRRTASSVAVHHSNTGAHPMKRYLAILAVSCTVAMSLTAAEAQTPPAPETLDAKALLMRMADYLAKAESFSVTMDAAYDVVQSSGEKIEFGEVRRIVLNRPNGLRIELTKRDGSRQQVMFDGNNLTVFNAAENIFASLAHPGSVDETVRYLVEDMHTRIPLSALLQTSFPRDLGQLVTEVAVVGHETIGGSATEHLAARMNDRDFQVWIASGEQPVPLRIVLTYKQATGQPQFQATLSDWNFHPDIDRAAFVFTRPAEAEAVAFIVPATRSSPGQGKTRK